MHADSAGHARVLLQPGQRASLSHAGQPTTLEPLAPGLTRALRIERSEAGEDDGF